MSEVTTMHNYDDLRPQEFRFQVNGKKYILREASEGAATEYRSASLRGAEIIHNEDRGDRTIRGMVGIADVEPLLVSRCVFEVLESGQEKAVPKVLIDGWPAKVVKDLFERVKQSSDLEEKDDLPTLKKQRERLDKKIAKLEIESNGKHTDAEDPAKNSQSATADTSV